MLLQGQVWLCAVFQIFGVQILKEMLLLQVWDLRHKRSVVTMTEQYQVTSVAFSEAGDQVSVQSYNDVPHTIIYYTLCVCMVYNHDSCGC